VRSMSADYYDRWTELSEQAWGRREPSSVSFGIEEGIDALCEYANEGGTGYEALEAIEAATEFFRAASLEITGELS
jgi:hypothetical protein